MLRSIAGVRSERIDFTPSANSLNFVDIYKNNGEMEFQTRVVRAAAAAAARIDLSERCRF